MKIIIKLSLYFIEILKKNLRTIRAILKYQHVQISAGVIIGPGCDFGKEIKIYKDVIIANSTIGDYSYIGNDSVIKNCTIGKFSCIAPNVKISLGVHPVDKISTYPGFYSKKAWGAVKIGSDPSIVEHQLVTIGHDVWIGINCLIMDGIEIGNGAVIAAGSVVTKDVKPYAIVGGVPAKLIKMRFNQEQITLLETFKWWNKDLDFCKKHAQLFLDPEQFFIQIKDGTLNV